ncbi:MAG TPA: nuclear transport factor 2 family protein [Cytophagales bacterium]
MSEQNKAVLVQANALVTRGDQEGFLSFCTDDTHWTFVGEQTLQGKEAVRAYMQAQYVKPPVVTVENLIAKGEYVTATGKISLKDESGKMSHYAYCDVWRFREGKLAELNAFVVEILDH